MLTAIQTEKLRYLLPYARAHSPFYRALYAQLAPDNVCLQDYPILPTTEFWQANGIEGNQVLTQSHADGITFKSGGSTGNPKYSVFTNQEWHDFTRAFGQGMRRAGLQAGEPIGNLFYAGRLYASFLFIGKSIEQAGVGMCYPIAGGDNEEIIHVWQQFQLTTLAGVPTTLMNLLGQMDEACRNQLRLKRFLYGGEPMFADQIALLKQYFPECQVQSVGIAGVDYGELGWDASLNAEVGVHHCFDDSTILEIVDEMGDSIEAVGQAGLLVITNLNRKLMPIIRYPVGDMGQWVDEPGIPHRRFQVLGRSDSGARIGPMTLYVDDVVQLVQHINGSPHLPNISNFQIVAQHFGHRDQCCLRFATLAPNEVHASANQYITDCLYQQRPMFLELLNQQLIHPLVIEWVGTADLSTNPRTGKLLRVIDQRHQT